jgi:hypothetical protein
MIIEEIVVIWEWFYCKFKGYKLLNPKIGLIYGDAIHRKNTSPNIIVLTLPNDFHQSLTPTKS